MFGEFRLVRALTDEQIAPMRDPRPAGTVRLPRIEDAVKAGGFPPAGGHHRGAEGGREALSRPQPRHLRHPARHPARRPAPDLDRFANEVIPAFRDTRTAAAAQ